LTCPVGFLHWRFFHSQKFQYSFPKASYQFSCSSSNNESS
jgi:hypothetical protein